MTASPLSSMFVLDIPKGGFLSRLRGRPPREAVFASVRNLLASHLPSQVSKSDIGAILSAGGLTHDSAGSTLQQIFEEAVLVLAADGVLTDAEIEDIDRLASAFAIATATQATITERAVSGVYEKALREALDDSELSRAEQERLDNLVKGLRLNEATRIRIVESVATPVIASAYAKALADGRVFESEEAAIDRLAEALGVPVNLHGEALQMVERGRQLARIDSGDLPQVEVPIMLTKGESCYFHVDNAKHSELRTVTKRVNYSGPTGSVRIMKGLRWRYGSVSVSRVTQDVLTAIDTGAFYVTSKKVLFQGERKNTAIPLAKVLHFEVYKDGVRLEKHSGKDMYVTGDADWEVAGACIEQAVERMHGE